MFFHTPCVWALPDIGCSGVQFPVSVNKSALNGHVNLIFSLYFLTQEGWEYSVMTWVKDFADRNATGLTNWISRTISDVKAASYLENSEWDSLYWIQEVGLLCGQKTIAGIIPHCMLTSKNKPNREFKRRLLLRCYFSRWRRPHCTAQKIWFPIIKINLEC